MKKKLSLVLFILILACAVLILTACEGFDVDSLFGDLFQGETEEENPIGGEEDPSQGKTPTDDPTEGDDPVIDNPTEGDEPNEGDDPVIDNPTDGNEPTEGDDPTVTPPTDEPNEDDNPIVDNPTEGDEPTEGDDPVVDNPTEDDKPTQGDDPVIDNPTEGDEPTEGDDPVIDNPTEDDKPTEGDDPVVDNPTEGDEPTEGDDPTVTPPTDEPNEGDDPVIDNPTEGDEPTEDNPEVELPTPVYKDYVRIITEGLNVRSGVGTSYPVLAVFTKGDLLPYLGTENGWYKTTVRGQIGYVSGSSTYTELCQLEVSNDERIEKIVSEGENLLGTPYVYGAIRYHNGNGVLLKDFDITEFDCSSLMQYIFYKGNGALLGLTTRDQVSQGAFVERENIQRGDLLFFTNEDRVNQEGLECVGHVALYLGNNYILHTASDYAVIEEISDVRWSYYIEARRIALEDTPTVDEPETPAVEKSGTPSTGTEEEQKYMWDFFLEKFGNEYAAAAMMGNLYAESVFKSDNLQQSYEKSLGHTDKSYTEGVDNGSYTNFVRDAAGYGLAQWTFWSRKEMLLDFATEANKSIGDFKTQIDFLWYEMSKDFSGLVKSLKAVTSIREASDLILHKYEQPADQSVSAEEKRAKYSQTYFDKFHSVDTAEYKQYLKITATALNVRSGPDTTYSIVHTFNNGDMLPYLGTENGWYKTTVEGQICYLSGNADYTEFCQIEKSDNESIEKVIAEGEMLLGTPYVYGAIRYHNGNGVLLNDFDINEFDCSSLMQYIFYKGNGALLGLTTRDQVSQGTFVERENIQRGDLLFFTNEDRVNEEGLERVGHVAIYLGNNYILHTASDYAVIEEISEVRWSYFIEARRIIE